ncbi:MAG: DUF1957 domain-containing protein, partial [Candidatus Competibacteraceae bacterium]|nr:DUF1957 domain-containing protein [Candidatus Competibacteraceae bacterium]
MPKGYLAFILHAHLPYVRHPEHVRFLEERWLFEAITESYIPLIQVFDRLLNEHIPCRLTLSVSPSLLAMLEDALLMERYEAHLNQLIELSVRELARTQSEPRSHDLAEFYHGFFVAGLDNFVNRCRRRLATAFRQFHEQGVINLITTTATHGFIAAIGRDKPK